MYVTKRRSSTQKNSSSKKEQESAQTNDPSNTNEIKKTDRRYIVGAREPICLECSKPIRLCDYEGNHP